MKILAAYPDDVSLVGADCSLNMNALSNKINSVILSKFNGSNAKDIEDRISKEVERIIHSAVPSLDLRIENNDILVTVNEDAIELDIAPSILSVLRHVHYILTTDSDLDKEIKESK